MQAAQAGDAVAFEELHRRYHRLVLSVLQSEMRCTSDCPDVAQEVFTTAWRRIGALRDHSAFRPWLLQITRRQAIDHARWMGRRPTLTADDELCLVLAEDVAPGPVELAEAADLAGRLRDGVATLAPRDATAIALAAQQGYGTAELAEALGITTNNAKVVLHRARTRLRVALAA
ncbi:MAG: sigma-70 family RNA polymerase sigma factor [Ilumatobacteraceae bacterium]